MRDFITFFKGFCEGFWLSKGVMMALLTILVILAFLISHFEDMNFLNALYMALITALTVGYGDLVPVTLVGKALCICIGYLGLIFVGLTVAIATIALQKVVEKEEK